MSILQIILLAVTVLVAGLLIAGLFTKRAYSLERIVDIDIPRHEVFNFIKYLKNQDHYNKWVMMDPGMKKMFRGDDGASGFVYAWDGRKAGAGEQEITNITEGKRIDMEVRFIRPFKGQANAYIETAAGSTAENLHNSTKVKWVFGSQLNYPANIMLLFMNMDKTIGKDMETSLLNLKTILENH